jgi:hypothetical protein
LFIANEEHIRETLETKSVCLYLNLKADTKEASCIFMKTESQKCRTAHELGGVMTRNQLKARITT